MENLIAGAKKLGLDLNKRQVEKFYLYYREMMEWNRVMNLTSITIYEDVQIIHFLDSLTLTRVINFSDNLRIIDIGTGAGLPGIPVKIMFPDIKLALLEATTKKAEFLRHITQKLGLNDIDIIVERAETIAHFPEYRESFDAVISRAVGPFAILAELTLPFCKIGGVFTPMKKGNINTEVEHATNSIELMGGKLRKIVDIDLEEFKDQRHIALVDKISPTPEKYPRRPGIPKKRPIR
jgi:16S rRNA (guanine527-N7)-methyltransferase